MRLAIAATALLALTASCTKHERQNGGGPVKPSPTADPVAGPEVALTLASVTLADDCATAEAPASPPMPARRAPPGKVPGDAPASMAPGVVPMRRRCEQTTMQLMLAASGKSARTDIQITKVELFEKIGGKSMGTMVPREPQAWVDAAGAYQTWDGMIGPGQQLKTMYKLSAPDWSVIGGKWNAQGLSFRVVVTVKMGSLESTAEATVEGPEIMVEPAIPT